MKSIRKPHNQDAGYIAERKFNGSHIVIYEAAGAEIDTAPDKYAVVCSEHGTLCGVSSMPKARELMKSPEFCEECMKSDQWALRKNPRFRNALAIAREENRERVYNPLPKNETVSQ
jgi:hypothetical protein